MSVERRVVSGEKAVHSFRDLKVWQKAIDLADGIYDITAAFPQDEKFGLVSQLRRSAVSVASNIAEGCARQSTKEYLHFLAVGRGSLAELETQLIVSARRRYASEDCYAPLLEQIEEVSRMLAGLQNSLRAKVA